MENLNKETVQTKPIKEKKNKKRFYRGAVAVLRVITKCLFFTKVTGAENMPKEGAVIVCCNHMSNWDPVMVACALKRPVNFMAKKELFDIKPLGKVLGSLGAFSVDRDNVDITAIKTAITLTMKKNEPVGIFPQGTRLIGKKPSTESIKSGTGMLVYKTQSDVLPVSVYTKGYKMRIFKRLYINIGKPIKYEEYNVAEKGQEGYQKISDHIFNKICELNDESAGVIKN